MGIDSAARSLLALGRGRSQAAGQDATVTRVDEYGTAYASVAGGEEFPLAQGVAVGVGQLVPVEWRNGTYVATGNYSDPPDNSLARDAHGRLDEIDAIAEQAGKTLSSMLEDAAEAGRAVQDARASARAASFGLADVERVLGTVGNIAAHGHYASQSGKAFDSSATYYVRDAKGARRDSDGNRYSLVAEPVAEDVDGYYRLVVDEAIANYLSSHLWQDGYGLNLDVDESGGYRLHEGTVDGSRAMGLYILDAAGDVVLALNAGGGQVGRSGESHMELDYHSLRLVDGEDDPNTYVWMSDLRPESGVIAMKETFAGSDAVMATGSEIGYVFPEVSLFYFARPAILTSVDATLNGKSLDEIYCSTIAGLGAIRLLLPYAVEPDDAIVVRYRSESPVNKAYTLGVRDPDAQVGSMSLAEGYGTAASSIMAHAEGYKTLAGGYCSHAEGRSTRAASLDSHAEGCSAEASGWASHSEGRNTTASGRSSHAEGGGSTASGQSAHAEGASATASGYASHAQNLRTVAAADSQTALGKYNVEHPEADNVAVVVGNGASDSARSDAATLDWDGNAALAGGLSLHGKEALPVYEVPAAWSGNGAAFIAKLPARPCVALSTDGYELWFDADASTDSY